MYTCRRKSISECQSHRLKNLPKGERKPLKNELYLSDLVRRSLMFLWLEASLGSSGSRSSMFEHLGKMSLGWSKGDDDSVEDIGLVKFSLRELGRGRTRRELRCLIFYISLALKGFLDGIKLAGMCRLCCKRDVNYGQLLCGTSPMKEYRVIRSRIIPLNFVLLV